MAQSVQCPTADFGSGHDLTVPELEPGIRLHADSTEPAWDSLSPSVSLPPPMSLSLPLKIKHTQVRERGLWTRAS